MAVKLLLAIILFVALSFPVYADGGTPVVCLSNTGSLSLSNYNVSNCGAPQSEAVLVTLRVRAGDNKTTSLQLLEGSLMCAVGVPALSTADCVVTVRDGSVQQINVSLSENYVLLMQWGSPLSSSGTISPVVTSVGVYTTTLSSGDTLAISRTFSYGEVASGTLLFFICLLLVFSLIAMNIRR